MNTRSNGERHSTGQWIALAVGAIFTLVGLVGFAITGFDDFAGRTHETLMGFEINGLHNIVHLVIGVAGLIMWRRADSARTYGWILFAGYGLTFFYGLAVAGKDSSDGNFLSINAADNILHLLGALAGLVVAQTAYRGIKEATGARGSRTATAAGR
jgi:hypothetical protein